MEILKRAKGMAAGEIASWNENPESVREEVLKRSARAGYTTRYGESVHGTKIQSVCGFDFLPTKINGKIIGD